MVFTPPAQAGCRRIRFAPIQTNFFVPVLPEVPSTHSMKASVRINRGVESLFGTRDENIRLIESGLCVHTQLVDNNLEIEGEADRRLPRREYPGRLQHPGPRRPRFQQRRPEQLPARGHRRSRSVAARAGATAASQRNFGKKMLAPKTVNQRRYLEAIERNDLVFGIGPAGTGKTYLAVAMAIQRAHQQAGGAHHPDAPRGGSRRAARLSARHFAGKGRSVPAPAVRRALRHARHRTRGETAGAQRDRSRAHRLHARPHAERQLHHSGRSAEQHAPSR